MKRSIRKAITVELISLGSQITPYLRTLPFGDVLNVPFPSIVEILNFQSL